MLTLNDGRNELWQWDTGRKLTVDADCSQVHFSNKVFGRSIDVDVVDGVAEIPDFLLQTDKDLTAWAFVGTAENGYTKISKVFKVNKRNKPADYVFTPPEQTTLEEILEKIDYLESIQDPDAIKNAVEDYLEQNPVEAPVQSVNGKTGEVELTAEDVGAISRDELQEATNEVLAQAKASGEFNGKDGIDGKDGKDGYTPVKGVDYFDGQPGEKGEPGQPGSPGKDGKDGTPGADGKDYVITPDDYAEIAEMAAELVEVPEVPEVSMKPLTFTGAVTATYDGSEAVSVKIPQGGGGSGGVGALTTKQIAALNGMFKIASFTEDPTDAYAAFKTAFGIAEPEEPEVTLTSISATYSGGDVAVGTAVNDLAGIVVAAHYSDGTSKAVTGYTLSGTIAEGSNTVTVSYGGKTTTFTVVGVAESGEEVIDIAPYLKVENKTISTVYNGEIIRLANLDGSNVYSVPVESNVTYRLGYVAGNNWTNLLVNNAQIASVGTGRLPLSSADTDFSTESIKFTTAQSVSYTNAVAQGNGEYLYALDIVFANSGFFLFSIDENSVEWFFKKVVA